LIGEKVKENLISLFWLNLGAGIVSLIVFPDLIRLAVFTLGISIFSTPVGFSILVISHPFVWFNAFVALSIAFCFVALGLKWINSAFGKMLIGAFGLCVAVGAFQPLFMHKMEVAMKDAVIKQKFDCIAFAQNFHGVFESFGDEFAMLPYAVARKSNQTYIWSFKLNEFVYFGEIKGGNSYVRGVKPSCN
jgi:hypothetical protein